MIASIQGVLESWGEDWVRVNVGGVGFQVFTPSSTINTLGTRGDQVKLYTHLQVRDDALLLYGFSTEEELRLFHTLIGVGGLGPRLGLAMLSSMKAEQLATAIVSGSTDVLTTIPGIGKRVAERIILELKDRLGAVWAAAAVPPQVTRENEEVLSALTALGYSPAEAARAVASLPPTSLSLEEKVKQALQYFGTK